MPKHFAPVKPPSARQRRGCLEKSWYTTKKNARDHAKRQTRLSGQKITWYECEFCGMYHLTSQKKPRDSRGYSNGKN